MIIFQYLDVLYFVDEKNLLYLQVLYVVDMYDEDEDLDVVSQLYVEVYIEIEIKMCKNLCIRK